MKFRGLISWCNSQSVVFSHWDCFAFGLGFGRVVDRTGTRTPDNSGKLGVLPLDLFPDGRLADEDDEDEEPAKHVDGADHADHDLKQWMSTFIKTNVVKQRRSIHASHPAVLGSLLNGSKIYYRNNNNVEEARLRYRIRVHAAYIGAKTVGSDPVSGSTHMILLGSFGLITLRSATISRSLIISC